MRRERGEGGFSNWAEWGGEIRGSGGNWGEGGGGTGEEDEVAMVAVSMAGLAGSAWKIHDVEVRLWRAVAGMWHWGWDALAFFWRGPWSVRAADLNDARLRRGLARGMGGEDEADGRSVCELLNSRGEVVFTQSWTPSAGGVKAVVVLLHGLNEHGGRYAGFARALNARGYGVYAMDWSGHGGSDGLHGYVESLDQVVRDARLYLKQVTAEHPSAPVFMMGHSTGAAIALKASVLAADEKKTLRGVVLSAPAVRVRPSHPVVAAFAPLFSTLLPRFQFRWATKGQAAVSRDPRALVAKYSDPLVYTGPMRIRTGNEILRLCGFLRNNMNRITTPFLVLHGSRDEVTDPRGSRDLYETAASAHKSIRIYDGLLHDLLFELEKDAIIGDIIRWLDGMLQQPPCPSA